LYTSLEPLRMRSAGPAGPLRPPDHGPNEARSRPRKLFHDRVDGPEWAEYIPVIDGGAAGTEAAGAAVFCFLSLVVWYGLGAEG
jgi:hypothetical protein